MTRLLSTVRLAVALTVAGLIAPVVAWSTTAGPAGAVASTVGTPLPGGWELCVLQGLSAPATQANVSNLAAWQNAEGGSTNNTAAYNPFNTSRTTNAANQPLPEVDSSNGFPTFANWAAGCAATVATMLQFNMWPIVTALREGNVSPPGGFLATVDQSQWCAPSADGQPCYLNAIVGTAGVVAQPAVDTASALSVFSDVKSELHNYEVSILTTGLDQNQLTARDWQLVIARSDVSTSQNDYLAVQHTLRHFAVDEYENSGLFEASEFLGGSNGPTPFGLPDANGVVAHQYERVIASALVVRYQAAQAGVEASVQRRADASKAVTEAAAKLLFDDGAEDRSLARLVSAVATMQEAGACTAATLVSTPVAPATPAASTPGTAATTTTTTTTTAPPSSTPTTAAPTTTTTTTAPVIRTATAPTIPTLSSTTTTTTAPPSTTTTTTTAPPSTTTTTTVPATPTTGPPPPVNTAAIGTLQGCVATLTPTAAPVTPS